MLSRRDVLRAGATLTGTSAASRLVRSAPVPADPFAHGVASGDPTSSEVVLWTRLDGIEGDATVRWTVGRDDALAEVVQQGEAPAPADADHTVHVAVAQLEPATTYFYAFDHGGTRSPVGRTRTARDAGDPAEVRLGVVSCSSFAAGPFSAYRRLAAEDVDLVVHLGDYLYESGDGLRQHDPPGVAVTLDDYRRRHAQQRSDPDLQRLHAALPVSAVWDDHDVAGNAWRGGADDHDPEDHGPWELRRAAAIRAWLEWLPVRRPDPSTPERIWRNLPLGGAADLLLLDTRHDGRDEQVSADDPDAAGALASPERRLVSEAQEAWLTGTLAGSTAAWRVLGNQVVLTPLAFEVPDPLAGSSSSLGLTIEGKVVNPDAWDGYPAARARVLEAIAAAGPTVVLTGDVHSSWAFEVPGQEDEPVAVEWVAPSVTSEPFSEIVRIPTPALAPAAVDVIAGQLPQVRWAELTQHGYLIASFDAERAQCDWWHVDLADGQSTLAASWAVRPDDGRLFEAEPLPARAVAPPPTSPPPAPPGADAGGDGGPSGATLAGGAAALCGAAVAGVLALRRRRSG